MFRKMIIHFIFFVLESQVHMQAFLNNIVPILRVGVVVEPRHLSPVVFVSIVRFDVVEKLDDKPLHFIVLRHTYTNVYSCPRVKDFCVFLLCRHSVLVGEFNVDFEYRAFAVDF